MKKDREKLTDSLRSEQRAKRRKTNLILNSLIVVVLLLIVIVSVNIFGKDDKTVANQSSEQTVAVEESNQVEQTDKEESEESSKESTNEEEENADFEESLNDEESTVDEEQGELDENDPDMDNAINNSAYEPIESSQVEPAQDYIKGSVDWNEQVQAISNATGFDQGKGDTLLKLGNNGPKKSAATIKIKETNQQYRVYLEWVDGQGWSAALVEEIAG